MASNRTYGTLIVSLCQGWCRTSNSESTLARLIVVPVDVYSCHPQLNTYERCISVYTVTLVSMSVNPEIMVPRWDKLSYRS